ncbi:glycosyltransferase family 2 protein [bacterium]|nr:glycosyltransferase family 2 protein [bacterium]MCP5461640.1 glycosyltransferase family 2 protein [bacterium]
MKSISIVMPAYNEEAIIERSVRNFYNEILRNNPDCEFIVVDDWSTDNTPIILKNLQKEIRELIVVKTPVNSGHGIALRTGFNIASKEYVFHTDSDYQHDPKDFWKLHPYIEQYDFVFGVRQNRQDPLHRKIISRMVLILNRLLFGAKLRDANCPFRLYKRETLKRILNWVNTADFAPSIQIALTASYFGVGIKEIPVNHYPRKTGTVSIFGFKLLKACMRSLKQMVALRWRLRGKKNAQHTAVKS